MNKKIKSLKEAKLPLFLFSGTFPHRDHWKHICIVPVSGHSAEKSLFLVLVLGAAKGSNILDLSLCFISGEKQVVERCW